MSLTIDQQLDLITRGAYVSDPFRADALTAAADQTSACFFGRNYNRAVALRAAHELVLSNRVLGEPGTIQSKKEGQLSITFGKTSAVLKDDSYLAQTTFGLQLLNLQRSTVPAISVTGGGLDNVCNTATEPS